MPRRSRSAPPKARMDIDIEDEEYLLEAMLPLNESPRRSRSAPPKARMDIDIEDEEYLLEAMLPLNESPRRSRSTPPEARMDIVMIEDEEYLHEATLPLNESPQAELEPTRKFIFGYFAEERQRLYTLAAFNLSRINNKLITFKPVPFAVPHLDDICRGNYSVDATRVPPQYGFKFFITNINIIAGELQYIAQPHRTDIDPEINKGIWFLNCDAGHSFSAWFYNIRYNLIVMVFLWALDAAGSSDRRCKNPVNYQFRTLFVEAWLESLVHDGTFTKQMEFLNLWEHSDLDLITFGAGSIKQARKAVKILREKTPKFPTGDPRDLFKLINSGDFKLGYDILTTIKNEGPALALHFVMTDVNRAEDLDTQLAGAANVKAEQCFKGDTEMDLGDDVAPAVDLSRVDWDSGVLRSLTHLSRNLDVGTYLSVGRRPETKRTWWMDEQEAIDLLFTHADDVTKMLDMLDALSF